MEVRQMDRYDNMVKKNTNLDCHVSNGAARNRLQTDQGCDIGSSCRHTFACPLGGTGIITTFFVHVCSRVRGGEDVLEGLDKYTLILISQYYENIPLAKWGCERVLPQYLSNHRYIGHREIKAKTGL